MTSVIATQLTNGFGNNIFQYIDGLICLPRIPYILKLLYENSLRNPTILDSIAHIPPQITAMVIDKNSLRLKQHWVNSFYPSIKEKLESLK